jgi:hypothetical protein
MPSAFPLLSRDAAAIIHNRDLIPQTYCQVHILRLIETTAIRSVFNEFENQPVQAIAIQWPTKVHARPMHDK